MNFEPSYTHALERLSRFVPKAGRDYAARRNYDRPAHPDVSTLSPYLRHRILTEAEVLAAVLGRHSAQAADKFIQEVFWRSYWKGWLELRPQIWGDYQLQLRAAIDDVQTQSGLRGEFEAACLGDTDIDCFNSWALEIVNTGYLHNHARMWFASIWIHTLRLPWQLGADFFLRHLLDGDPASNTLSWRWVAGLHTVGKSYLARASNIESYTDGRFKPAADAFADAPLPLADAPRPAPRPCPRGDRFFATARTGLLLHDDDLSPGYLLEVGLKPIATLGMSTAKSRSPLCVAELPLRFADSAVKATCARYADRLGNTATLTSGETSAEAIADWARDAEIDQIVTPYAPTGPNAEILDTLTAMLEARGIALHRIMRAYDSAAWPHATAGFFKFKAHIPALLEGI